MRRIAFHVVWRKQYVVQIPFRCLATIRVAFGRLDNDVAPAYSRQNGRAKTCELTFHTRESAEIFYTLITRVRPAHIIIEIQIVRNRVRYINEPRWRYGGQTHSAGRKMIRSV